MMTTTLNGKAPASERLVSFDDNQESPNAKKAKEDQISLHTFIHDATRGLDLWISHGIISKERKVELLSPYTDTYSRDKKATLSVSESTHWFSQTLQGFALKYNNLRGDRAFLTFPFHLSGKVFREQASRIVDVYMAHLGHSLHECAEAARRNQPLMWIADHDPYFPMKPVPQGQYPISVDPFSVTVKFKTLYEFCHKRLPLFIQRNADDLDCVIVQLWRQESRRLVSLSAGHEALEWGKQICRDIKKGDFNSIIKKKELAKRIERYVEGIKNICKKSFQMDFKTECFKATKPFEEYEFPITISPKNPLDICIVNAWLIKNWMLQFHTQQILKEMPEFERLMCKVRGWAEAHLKGDLFESEVEACDAIRSALV